MFYSKRAQTITKRANRRYAILHVLAYLLNHSQRMPYIDNQNSTLSTTLTFNAFSILTMMLDMLKHRMKLLLTFVRKSQHLKQQPSQSLSPCISHAQRFELKGLG